MSEPTSEASGAPRADSNGEHRLIVAGFGGQGVLTFGRLVCLAAMSEGRQVTYLPSYGAEVRGGTANCQVVVAEGPIYSPLVEAADALVVLNQLSYDRFAGQVRPDGLLMVNSTVVDVSGVQAPPEGRAFCFPVSDLAAEMGNIRVANVIMLGAFVRATGLLRPQDCLAAIGEQFGASRASLVALNQDAFRRGEELVAAGG
jgi:2-oxoglutarate ferredoxin oxidoreductase subunit gamma